MPEKTQQCVGLTQLLPTLYKFRQNEEHLKETARTVDTRKITAVQDTISDRPRMKLKNRSSDTDIRPMLYVVCGNIQCPVQRESTGSAGASVTTSSTGMSS